MKKNSNRWFFTADLHLGHFNIIKYCKRPFLSKVEQELCDMAAREAISHKEINVDISAVKIMDLTIIESINAVVGCDDNLVVIGDFCLARGKNAKEVVKKYRDRINCKNIYLILGNHDRREDVDGIFTACYENYLFKINGQDVFASHYPCRSWNRAYHGSFMLYGHVHNLYHDNDNGRLSDFQKKTLEKNFSTVFQKWNLPHAIDVMPDLLDAVASLEGSSLTLDVGVDNVRNDKPFGTPWSLEEIHEYMQSKKLKWLLQKGL